MVEHAFITFGWPSGRDSAHGCALGPVTALGPPKRDERISQSRFARVLIAFCLHFAHKLYQNAKATHSVIWPLGFIFKHIYGSETVHKAY